MGHRSFCQLLKTSLVKILAGFQASFQSLGWCLLNRTACPVADLLTPSRHWDAICGHPNPHKAVPLSPRLAVYTLDVCSASCGPWCTQTRLRDLRSLGWTSVMQRDPPGLPDGAVAHGWPTALRGLYYSRGHCVRSSWLLVTIPQCWIVPFAWLVSELTTEVWIVKNALALSFWKIPSPQRGEEARELTCSLRTPVLTGVLRQLDRAYQSVSLHREEAEPPWLYLFWPIHCDSLSWECFPVWKQRAGLDALTLAYLASLCRLSLVLLFCYPFWHLDLEPPGCEQIGARLGHGLPLTVLHVVNIGKTYCL